MNLESPFIILIHAIFLNFCGGYFSELISRAELFELLKGEAGGVYDSEECTSGDRSHETQQMSTLG